MTTVAILSDIHMRDAYSKEITETLRSIENELAAHAPAHTFVLGDLIEDDTRAHDLEHIKTVKSIFDEFPSPVTYLLGNHDIGTLSRSEIGAALGQERFYGQVTVDGQQFVYLDSAIQGASPRGTLGAEQRDWLSESVEQDAVVLVHHPVGNFSLAENPWFNEFPERAYLWDRKELLDLMVAKAVTTISGHIHQNEQCRFRGLSHASINAVSKERPDVPVSGTYAILSLGEQFELKRYRRGTKVSSYSLE